MNKDSVYLWLQRITHCVIHRTLKIHNSLIVPVSLGNLIFNFLFIQVDFMHECNRNDINALPFSRHRLIKDVVSQFRSVTYQLCDSILKNPEKVEQENEYVWQ